MTNDPRLTPLAASLPATVPFVGPEARERQTGRPFVARLGANENAFGPSPWAIAAMRRAAMDSWKYGDSESHDLRSAIAEREGVSPENVMVGEGIDGLLGMLVRLFVGLGDNVVTSDGAYPTFNYHVAGFGGVLHKIPYTGDFEDPSRLIAKAKDVGAKLIYIANPDNPMGTVHDAVTVVRMVQAVPEGALLVLDEAYLEFADESVVPDIPIEDTRVIRMRTFSKAYGLAGARVGYALGPKSVISAFDRVRNHFGMSRMSQAGALAAYRDAEWLANVRAEVILARRRIGEIAADNGLTIIPSSTNFVCIDCGRDGVFAKRVLDALDARGIFVRMPFVAPQNRCIRVSCGTPEELDSFAEALPLALAEAAEG